MKSWSEELLSKNQNSKHDCFDFEIISNSWKTHKANESNNISQLWPILQFNQWYNHHIDN